MTKVVSYVRVSTAGQGRSGLGLEAQRNAVATLSKLRGYEVLAEFAEVESGAAADRPELAKALHHARVTGAILVIAKLDRLSRNAAFLLALRDSGVRFIAADIPDANDLTIGLLAVVAQAEREAISRRTTEALAAIKARIEAEGSYTSPRSGRTLRRLGNPNGARALREVGSGSSAGAAAARCRFELRAKDLEPILANARAKGIHSLQGLADHLNAMGALTARGGRWHPSTVSRISRKIGSWNEGGAPSSERHKE